MTKGTLELSVGVFVLIGIAAIAYVAIQLGSGSLSAANTYVIEARFVNSGGLHSGSNVELAGVPIGRVEGVRVDPVDFSAIATLRIRDEIELPTDTMASIKTAGLIGDKFVALLPGADEALLESGSRIILTESAVDLESLISRMAFGDVDEQSTDTPAP